MNICVFGAASNKLHNDYFETVESLGEMLAKRGHHLIFGAGSTGLMGAAARGVKKAGGKMTGIIPTFFREESIELIYNECDEIIYTDSMRERKAKMEDLAEAFIVVPGGIGTFEELFEILTLKQLGRHKKPIAIYNIKGYYDSMENMMENAIDENFVNESCKVLYEYFDSASDIFEYIENHEEKDFSLSDLKNN
ncbi:MAG: TIGR00730 family Rossman fold protein [Acutalibacteraceae bacterium]